MCIRQYRWYIAQVAMMCLGVNACSSDDLTPEEQALYEVKSYIEKNMEDLYSSSLALCAAAPAPDGDGWNPTNDGNAISAMKVQWKRARVAYEHIEGAVAVLFPELDVATDERYDGFLATYGADNNLFDDVNVTGIHAIERILWADQILPLVLAFESTTPGYTLAAFPSNETQARDFKDKLCARLVKDITSLRDQFRPLALDPAAAFRGIIGSLEEQLEKAEKAATGEEESRYAKYTLADMRANVEAGRATFAAFTPWLEEKNATTLISQIQAGFDRLQAAYAALPGDELPEVPATFSAQNPNENDLQTPFGKLWKMLHAEADDTHEGSLVSAMLAAATVLGIPELP